VIGADDPADPGAVSRVLEAAGIEVIRIDHAPSQELLAPYASRVLRGRPFTTLLLAISRDGMIANRDGSPVAIMGEPAQRWARLQRAFADAVMIGARTAELDDPRLDVGLKGFEDRAYARVIALGKRPLPPRLNLTDWPSGHPTYVLAEEGREVHIAPPVEVLGVPGRNGRPDLRKAMSLLASRSIAALLVEGGAKLTEAMIGAELVDRLHLVQSSSSIGRDGLPATPLGGIEGRLRAAGFVEIESRLLGEDLLRTFEPAI
jgi:diaminohydroxyphosphoribosylaminopyrimidine deaminase / 5-amino-6-(5-phosphoribosylamino)uracil reductase